ncbi:MAG: hypothetical protein EBZ48_00155 [Proteobacteria bacterium]|nr:hypothetical protein [Pseudomonadota bacterium]
MNQGRIVQLQRAIESGDDQPFPFYALALEYKLLGDFENSQKFFDETLRRFPDYIPTFYHYGQLLELLAEPIQARSMYEQGVEVATQAGDSHAKAELLSALQNLQG